MKIKSLILSLAMLLLGATSVSALTDVVKISDLPEYTNADNFYLSYSALSNDPVTAQFYFRKDGNSYQAFDPIVNGFSGQVQVTADELSEQGKYFFKVEINGGTASDETSVIFDTSGPSPVGGYWKEQVSPGHYKLHWKNPGDEDIYKVLIYRSENGEFKADGSTRVGELGGVANEEKTWDDAGLDPNKTYFYALRVVDKAGNASSLVSDIENIIIDEEEIAPALEDGFVSVLRRESATGGEVLGDDEEGIDREMLLTGDKDAGVVDILENIAKDTTGKRIYTGIITIAFVYIAYRLFFRRKK